MHESNHVQCICVCMLYFGNCVRVLSAGRECATAFKALLELVHQIVLKPTPENKKKLPTFSKEVATSVGEVVQAAEAIRGEEREIERERERES